jgi:hypothetical protein
MPGKVSRRQRNPEVLFGTDQYRPPVGTTPSDKTPFVVEGSNEFPARNRWWSYAKPGGAGSKVDVHVQPIYYMPELHHRH